LSPAAENTGIIVAPGESQTFSIGGVGLRIACQPGGHPLTLPGAYRLFLAPEVSADVNVRVGSAAVLERADAPVIYGGGYHWRARGAAEAESTLCFEIFYPPTGETYCRMDGDAALSDVELVFGHENLQRLPDDFTRQCEGRLWFPHPFEQIVLIPSLARRGGFLIHACGAVVNGRAFVFAGHSGDGKTTLSRLLADEGVELLSDERIAICETENGFVAHGTPWAGEGEVVSSARFPLGGVFVLRKAATHRLTGGSSRGLESGAIGNLAAEVLARSLVPYYLPEEMARILSLVKRATHQVAFGELEFTREPGLRELLAEFESSDASDAVA
jgi:hypothetical protein